jgi:rieske iron-sulfur protein
MAVDFYPPGATPNTSLPMAADAAAAAALGGGASAIGERAAQRGNDSPICFSRDQNQLCLPHPLRCRELQPSRMSPKSPLRVGSCVVIASPAVCEGRIIIRRQASLELGLAALASVARPLDAHAIPTDQILGRKIGDVFVLESDLSRRVTVGLLPEGGAPTLVWPMDRKTGIVRNGARFNQILLLRQASQATPSASTQILAFTAICPHAACVVTEWVPEKALLRCPCHGSEYDPRHNGTVVAGPSPLPLPMLPIALDGDLVTIAGPYSAPPGGHTSRTT